MNIYSDICCRLNALTDTKQTFLVLFGLLSLISLIASAQAYSTLLYTTTFGWLNEKREG